MLDRVDVMVAAMSALLSDDARPHGDADAVGIARIRCTVAGAVVGLAVAKEVFGRMGGRVRVLVEEGEMVEAGVVVLEIGGPLGAIRGGAPTALRFLTRLSGVAAGVDDLDLEDPLEVWASEVGRLSHVAPVGDAGPTFELEGDL